MAYCSKPSGMLTNVLASRSLQNSHKRPEEISLPGLTVLDVGCETGAIKRGIAEATGPNHNSNLIEKACRSTAGIPGLTFEISGLYDLHYECQFDIVTS